jgi:hypothetical protein
MVLSIIFLEDKHIMLLHLSIFYEYQQFFQHRICFSIQPPDYSDPWPRLAHSSSFFLIMLFNYSIIMVQVRYITILTKEVVHTDLFFRIRTPLKALVLHTSAFTEVLLQKKKPVISNMCCFFCLNSTVSYTYSWGMLWIVTLIWCYYTILS